MKKSLFAILASLFGALFSCQADNFKSVDNAEFQKIIADSTVQVLDSRTAEEFAEGHLAGAINIDVLKNDFADKAASKLDKNRTVAVYCKSGRRSKKAAGILQSKGYSVIDLDHGYLGWVADELPVVN